MCGYALGLQSSYALVEYRLSWNFSPTEFSKSEPFQKFRNHRTQWVGPALCVFSYLQEPQCHGVCQWVSMVNPVGRMLEEASCQQVGQGTNSKPRYFYKKKVAKSKRCQQPASSTYQALRCFPRHSSACSITYIKPKHSELCRLWNKLTEWQHFWVHIKHCSSFGERGRDKINLQ